MIPIVDSVASQPAEMTLAAAVLMGALASSNVCAVVRLPILAAYVAGAGVSRKRVMFLVAFFALGLVGGTVLLGLTATSMADGVHKILQVDKRLFWLLGFCLVVVGVLLSGLIDLQFVPQRWRHAAGRLVQADYPGALLVGFVLGLLQTPACPTCRAELLTVVEGGAVAGSWLYGLLLLLGFAVGQSTMALGVGVLMGLLRPGLVQWLRTRMCSLEPRLRFSIGHMLIVLGLYFVLVG
jgi:hypothetical protein